MSAKKAKFRVGQVVCVYADGTHYYEQIIFANWCRKEFIYLTDGGHTSNLFNMRAQTQCEAKGAAR